MSEEVKKCIIDAVYVPFVSAGTHQNNWGVRDGDPYGCHALQARSDMIYFPDNETIVWPAEGLFGTEANLKENGRIQILANVVKDGKLVNGYRLEGHGEFQTEGPIFEKVKEKYDWARGCVVMKIDRVGQSREFVTRLLKY